jgi:hypothetical protein
VCDARHIRVHVAATGTAQVGIGEARPRISAEAPKGTPTAPYWPDGGEPQEAEASWQNARLRVAANECQLALAARRAPSTTASQ